MGLWQRPRLFLLALAAFVVPAAAAADRRPNVVIILADDFDVGDI
jgi:hypothetical protein